MEYITFLSGIVSLARSKLYDRYFGFSSHFLNAIIYDNKTSSFVSKLTIFKTISYLHMIVSVFRFINTAFVLRTNSTNIFFQYDLFMNYLIRINFMDANLALAMIPFPIVEFYFHFIDRLFRESGQFTWHMGYDILLENRRQFQILNPHVNLYSWNTWKALRNGAFADVAIREFAYFPNISQRIRSQTLAVSLRKEVLFATFFMMAGK